VPIAKDQAGFYEVFRPSFLVGGKWLGMPHSIVGNAIAYRKSWFKEVGFDGFPKTWDDLRKAAAQRRRRAIPTARPSATHLATPRAGRTR
jgi:multiple sugar transport system substrate-binding protein